MEGLIAAGVSMNDPLPLNEQTVVARIEPSSSGHDRIWLTDGSVHDVGKNFTPRSVGDRHITMH
jgi:hypothetical protein